MGQIDTKTGKYIPYEQEEYRSKPETGVRSEDKITESKNDMNTEYKDNNQEE